MAGPPPRWSAPVVDPGAPGEAPPPGYHGTEALLDEVERTAGALGQRADLVELGRSVEGRRILALTVTAAGARPSPARPQAVVVAGIHGVEVIATELALVLVRLLADPPPDQAAAVAALLAVADVTVVPTVNVDGRVAALRSLAGRRAWNPAPRRNAHGVDLNRNWPFPDGVVDTWLPLAGTTVRWLPWCRGPAPLSEPESRALAALGEALAPAVLLNLHSTGQIVTYPWGCKPEPPADLAGFERVAAAFTGAQPVPYRSKQSRAWYPILGSSNDWFHHRFGTLALTVETSPPAAEVRADPRRGRWAFWYANPVDRDRWVANDRDACLAALRAGVEHGGGARP